MGNSRELQRLLSLIGYGRSLWAELNGGENSFHWKANMLPLFSIMTLWSYTYKSTRQNSPVYDRVDTPLTNTIYDQFDRNGILTVYMQPFRIKDSYGIQEIFNLPFVADNLSKKYQSRIINFIDQMNGIQVTNFHNRSTEPLNYRIYSWPQSSKTTRVCNKYIDIHYFTANSDDDWSTCWKL